MLKNMILLTTTAFDNQVGWKTDDEGNISIKEGNPVYINSAGEEMTVGVNKISELNAEAKSHREAKQSAEEKLKTYGDLDPEIARKAIETVKKFDAKKLIDSGEVDKLKSDISNEFKGQLTEKDGLINQLQSKIDGMTIDRIFDNSQFIKNNIAVPEDMFQASFRNNFKVNEDGKIEAFDKSGNRIMSKEKVGEYADPEESLRILVEAHPQKDTILKANIGSGSGNNGNAGGTGQGRNLRLSDFAVSVVK